MKNQDSNDKKDAMKRQPQQQKYGKTCYVLRDIPFKMCGSGAPAIKEVPTMCLIKVTICNSNNNKRIECQSDYNYEILLMNMINMLLAKLLIVFCSVGFFACLSL